MYKVPTISGILAFGTFGKNEIFIIETFVIGLLHSVIGVYGK